MKLKGKIRDFQVQDKKQPNKENENLKITSIYIEKTGLR